MLISILLLTPLLGLYFISTGILQEIVRPMSEIRFIALTTSIINVIISSLFLLLAILSISSLMGSCYFDSLFKTIIDFNLQNFLFIGIFLVFAIKTPIIFLNIWLLKAHVK